MQLQTGYTENVHAAESSVDPQTAAIALTADTKAVGHLVRKRDLKFSGPKSHITLC